MSHAAVEKILGKLVTDETFRERFFMDPAVASFTAGLELSGAELDALGRLPKPALVEFSRRLDDRLRRLPLDSDQGRVSAGRQDAEADVLPAASRTGIDTAQRARKQRAE